MLQRLAYPSDDILALTITPKNSNILYAGTRRNGIFKSTDGGKSWKSMNTGLKYLLVKALVIHPWDPAILCAGTLGGGIFKIEQKAIRDKE